MHCLLHCCLVIFLLLSCGREKPQSHESQIIRWDRQLEENPRAILDSLKRLESTPLSEADRAYYNLLYTIATEKSSLDFENDSLIEEAMEWYTKGDDYFNQARALLYLGIVRRHLNAGDTNVDLYIRQALNICEIHHIGDSALQGLIFLQLGNCNSNYEDISSARNQYERAIKFQLSGKDSAYLVVARLNLAWECISQRNFDSTLMILKQVEQDRHLTEKLQRDLWYAYATTYTELENHEMALAYYQKLLLLLAPVNRQKNRIYYRMSMCYQQLGQSDSALFYSQRAIGSAGDAPFIDYLYYKNLADHEVQAENYKMAAADYLLALQKLQRDIERLSDIKIIELERKYNLIKSEQQVLKARQHLWVSLALAAVVLLLTGGVLVFIAYRSKRHKEKAEKFHKEAGDALFVSEIYRVATEKNRKIETQMDKFSQKYLKNDPGMYDELQDLLKAFRHDNRKELFKLLLDARNSHLKIIQEQIPNLTEEEMVLLMLFGYNWTSKQVADLLHTTSGNIATKKTYLKQKLQHLNPDFVVTSPVFNGKNDSERR